MELSTKGKDFFIRAIKQSWPEEVIHVDIHDDDENAIIFTINVCEFKRRNDLGTLVSIEQYVGKYNIEQGLSLCSKRIKMDTEEVDILPVTEKAILAFSALMQTVCQEKDDDSSD